MGHLVGANKTLIDHFAGIGNMVVMKSQFVTSPDVIPVLTGNLLFPFDWSSKRNEFDTFNRKLKFLADSTDHFVGINKMIRRIYG
ncbi:MAG: hypothetical protein IJ177_05525 [Fibrobacter sp.]|uniref:hypothetical protein n=1 Tax=Fibrobacter sp. TaxID=35828 RepID=UPI0025C0BF9B|nr:hypothetical protein [Fibrobacter sp.]MBQ9225632.1 hypothetical protein [Fibrobacter sp.]